MKIKQLKSTLFPATLFISILAGGLTGSLIGKEATWFKPIGDIFLNLIFVTLVPLVFFSISAAIANIGGARQLWKIFSTMLLSFLLTGIVAAIFMLFIVMIFPPAQGFHLSLAIANNVQEVHLVKQVTEMLTVTDFYQLFSHQNILPLILFSVLVGLATGHLGEKAKIFSQFLSSGAAVFMRVMTMIMYFAPIGFFAYFAVLVADLGPKLLESYFHVFIIYYLSAILYFVLAFSFYAYLAGKKLGVKKFWGNIFIPLMTSLATCSSVASIPANLQAAKKMGVSQSIYETVIPMGAVLHKDGSVLGGIIKIAFLFGIFHLNFAGLSVYVIAIMMSLLVGMVMGAIPSGGMLGEMLILSFYGFPPQTLMMIAAISIMIDPLATMINVTGDTVCSMLVSRLVKGRAWIQEKIVPFAKQDVILNTP